MYRIGAADLGIAVGTEDPDDGGEGSGGLVVEREGWGARDNDSVGGDVEGGGEAGGCGGGTTGKEAGRSSWWKGPGAEGGEDGAGE